MTGLNAAPPTPSEQLTDTPVEAGTQGPPMTRRGCWQAGMGIRARGEPGTDSLAGPERCACARSTPARVAAAAEDARDAAKVRCLRRRAVLLHLALGRHESALLVSGAGAQLKLADRSTPTG